VKESADELSTIHTYSMMTSMQKTCGQNHMKAEYPNKNVLLDHCMIHMREYNVLELVE
jgi:hypothetical protein